MCACLYVDRILHLFIHTSFTLALLNACTIILTFGSSSSSRRRNPRVIFIRNYWIANKHRYYYYYYLFLRCIINKIIIIARFCRVCATTKHNNPSACELAKECDDASVRAPFDDICAYDRHARHCSLRCGKYWKSVVFFFAFFFNYNNSGVGVFLKNFKEIKKKKRG